MKPDVVIRDVLKAKGVTVSEETLSVNNISAEGVGRLLSAVIVLVADQHSINLTRSVTDNIWMVIVGEDVDVRGYIEYNRRDDELEIEFVGSSKELALIRAAVRTASLKLHHAKML